MPAPYFSHEHEPKIAISHHLYPWLWHRFKRRTSASVTLVCSDAIRSYLTPIVLKISPTRPSSLQPSLATFARSNLTTNQQPLSFIRYREMDIRTRWVLHGFPGSINVRASLRLTTRIGLSLHLPTRLAIYQSNS